MDNGPLLVRRYESSGSWEGWTNDEKEMLLFTLYTVYRHRTKDAVASAMTIASLEQQLSQERGKTAFLGQAFKGVV